MMKYLFTFAFKTVQNSLVHLRNMEEALKKGKSSLLIDSLSQLQNLLPLLENITKPAYSDKQEEKAKELHQLISSLILLPEHIELSINEIEKKCHTFLQELDPFFIQTIESTGLRKARLIEELIEAQDVMESIIENFQSPQTSTHVLLTMLEEKIEEIQYIDTVGFSLEEVTELQDLFYFWNELNSKPTEKNGMVLLAKAISLENVLRNHLSYRDALEILEQGVKEAFQLVETKQSKKFLALLASEHVKDSMFLLSKYTFTDDILNFSLDEMFRQYKNLMEDCEEKNINSEELLLHLKNFSHHLDVVKQKLYSVEGLIEIDESTFLDDDEENQ